MKIPKRKKDENMKNFLQNTGYIPQKKAKNTQTQRKTDFFSDF